MTNLRITRRASRWLCISDSSMARLRKGLELLQPLHGPQRPERVVVDSCGVPAAALLERVLRQAQAPALPACQESLGPGEDRRAKQPVEGLANGRIAVHDRDRGWFLVMHLL
jgi:hypothetical protein